MTSLWSLLCLTLMLFESVSSGYQRVCYYASWSKYRGGEGRFTPENIDPYLCTHIIYAFASVDGSNIGLQDLTEEETLARVVGLKEVSPYLRVLIGLGGWVHGSAPFTSLVSSRTNMDAFARNVIAFLRAWDLDGLDLDWEYPASRGSLPGDKLRFTQLIRILRSAFEAEATKTGLPRFLLTAAVPIGKPVVQAGYEIEKISNDLDFINLMTYDLHGSWDHTLGHNSPLYPRKSESWAMAELNQDWGVTYWLSNGAPPEKLMLGIATYGRTFKTINGTEMGDKAMGPGRPGKFTSEAGFLAYFEICQNLQNGWTQKWHQQHQVPYAYYDDEWVGYDDIRSVTIKANYIKSRGLGGVMVWAIDMDDFREKCGNGPNPILGKLRDVLPNDNTGLVPYVPRHVSLHSTDEVQADNQEYKRVCYYTNWSQHRSKTLTFVPEDIDPDLCTHIIFSFAKLENNDIHTFEPNDHDLYRRVQALKAVQPHLVVLLAIGGWSHGTNAFSDTVATPHNILTFSSNAVKYLRKYKFDGLDLDWEFPGSRGSPPIDKFRFTSLVKGLRQEFDRTAGTTGLPRLLLTAAVSGGRSVIDSGYEIRKLASYLDFINIMAYDLHGSWESTTGHNSPLYSHDQNSQDFAVRYWMNQGAPRGKLVLGLGLYGRSFTLRSSDDHALGAEAVGPGLAQPHTKTDGFMAYFEICSLVVRGWFRQWSNDSSVPYAYSDTQWVGYDDVDSIAIKAQYVRSKGLGGAMVWSVDMDDYRNVCGDGRYPLMNKLKEVLTAPLASLPAAPAANQVSTIATARGPSPTALLALPSDKTTTLPSPKPLNQMEQKSLDMATCGPPSVCPYGWFIPDACNVSVYYQCSFRLAITRLCPPRLEWNIRRLTCDWPSVDTRIMLNVKTTVSQSNSTLTNNKIVSTFRTTVSLPKLLTGTTKHSPKLEKNDEILPTFRTTVYIPEPHTDTTTPSPHVKKNDNILPTFRTSVFIAEAISTTTTLRVPSSTDRTQRPRPVIKYEDCQPMSCPAGQLVADPCDQSCYFSCAQADLSYHACCPAPTVWDDRINNCNWHWVR
ncbi:probable chitinase 10 [Mizuhopecten yessoensis]|uniref:probable chitinase 10 n=1 Tax=Mizuhopecten yessoensis TaxID=6573 RepID=UPI000B45F18E|nr:probable chitinase 10 [Mizuhopecten yessoensis]XP_021358848.1 probable chitinase 10 [Mizuhopecten yessoensis]